MALPVIAIQLGIGLTLWALNKWVLNEEKDPPTKDPPKGLKLPRAGLGTIIPLVYGNTKIEKPVIYWAGNHVVLEPYELGGNEFPAQRRIDLLLGIGITQSTVHNDWRTQETPPRLMAIWVNGKRQALGAGGVGITHGQIWSPTFDLGGRGAGGTFTASIEFFDGRVGQNVTSGTRLGIAMNNANLGVPIDPNLVPGYEHQMCVSILTSPGAITAGTGYLGEATNLVSIAFEVQTLGSEAVLVDATSEANPAMVLYDLLCGDVYKIGYSTSRVDVTSFDACATTLATEGHGMSGIFSKEGDAPNLFIAILDQINGIIALNHLTGKLELKLIRADYNPSTIPHLTDSNTLADPEVDFVGWAELINEVNVEFTDRSLLFVENLATAQRGASAIGNSNRLRPRTVQYPSITSPTLAAALAARELGIASRPLMTAVAKVDRSLYAVKHGDAVKCTWANLVTGKIFRIIDIDHGQLDDGAITFTMIEDVFSETLGGYPPFTPPWGNNPPFEIPTIEEFVP